MKYNFCFLLLYLLHDRFPLQVKLVTWIHDEGLSFPVVRRTERENKIEKQVTKTKQKNK